MIEWLGYDDDRWFVTVDPEAGPLGICKSCQSAHAIGYIYCRQEGNYFLCLACAPKPMVLWARLEAIQAALACERRAAP
jgi:hypothetical protein